MARRTVHDRDQIQEAALNRVVGDVGAPDLVGTVDVFPLADLADHPLGDTDSELAFCLLLGRMRPLWRPPGKIPDLAARFAVFAALASELTRFGSVNLLYSDGDALFAHGHRRVYEENGRLSDPRPPGLAMRDCMGCGDGLNLHCRGLDLELTDLRTTLFASVPLTERGWQELPEGTAVACRDGQEILRERTL